MPSVLQEIAQRFETVDPARARELRRIEQVYISFGLSDGAVARIGDSEDTTRRLLRFIPRMARMRGFRLYPIGVGERDCGRFAHQALALLDARHLPTPGNALAVLDPKGTDTPTDPGDGFRQYSFEVWRDLQRRHGPDCALLLPDRQA